jgi:hypothetical protein
MQRERYSFFNHLSPFIRDTMALKYACTGIRQSCVYCPSYAGKGKDLGAWRLDEDWTGSLGGKKTKNNWLVPADMDIFTSDFPVEIREAFIEQLSGESLLERIGSKNAQQFFLCTKDLVGLSNYWSPVEHIVWSYSASSQEEVDFYAQIRFGAIASPQQKEALFLSPLVEPIKLPDVFLDHFKFIFIDGYYGSSRDLPLELRWIEAIASQLKEVGSSTQLIIEGLGDRPRLDGVGFKPKGAAFWQKTIQQLIGS